MKALVKTKIPHVYQSASGQFYVRMKLGQKKLFKSLRTSKITDAKIKADREIEAFLGLKETRGRKLVQEVWSEFLEIHSGDAPSTYRSMEIQGRLHLMPFFGEMLIDQVSEIEWAKYLAYAKKLTPRRKIFNDRKYFSMMMVHAFKQTYIQRRPTFSNPDPDIEAGKVYSDDEITGLLVNASGDLWIIIQMALTMGMRRGEILGLTWTRANVKKGLILLRAEDTKIREAREFAISDICLEALKARKSDASSEWVFPSKNDSKVKLGEFRKSWATCKKKAGVVGRFHDLRHTFLTRAFKAAVNPALICEYAGLSMGVAQDVYLHFNHEDTRVVSQLVRAP